MPLIAAALLAYICGLLAVSAPLGWLLLLAGVSVATWGARSARDRLALGALVTAGLACGVSARVHGEACERRLISAGAFDLTLDGVAQPGAFVRAHHACGVTVRLSVRAGRAPAGATVRARGAA